MVTKRTRSLQFRPANPLGTPDIKGNQRYSKIIKDKNSSRAAGACPNPDRGGLFIEHRTAQNDSFCFWRREYSKATLPICRTPRFAPPKTKRIWAEGGSTINRPPLRGLIANRLLDITG